MGLGKTVQSLAAISAYAHEWPLLILCPNGARFHWKQECLTWLGNDQVSQESIQVMEHGNRGVKPNTKIVICSYGILPSLLQRGRIHINGSDSPTSRYANKLPSVSFQCVIADESHMLKDQHSKRTRGAIPLLKMSKRCILLSGTPAFKNPMELFPQLNALGGDPTWENEKIFRQMYCNDDFSIGGNNLLSLHTAMTLTVMIRRKKEDVLKNHSLGLTIKIRDIAHITITDEKIQNHLENEMRKLRKTYGPLGRLAQNLELRNKNQSYFNDYDDEDFVEKKEERMLRKYEASIQSIDLKTLEKSYPLNERNDEEIKNHLSFISKLFQLSGQVKLNVIIGQLKNWLNENEGKIIVFAHHHFVLDAIQESLKGLRVARIDGTANSQVSTTKIDH